MVSSNEIQSNEECKLCPTIKKAKAEVDKILKNRPPVIEDVTKLRSTHICTIKTPNGQETLSLNDLEEKYTLNYPLWDKSCQSFPEGPIFNGKGKLLNGNLFTKATDIEEKRHNMKNDIISISSIPFDIEKDTDNEIIDKTVNKVVESLKVVIDDLDLANNPRVKNGLPKGLKGKIRGKLNELKTPVKGLDEIHEIQDEAFQMILANDSNFKIYEMR